MKRAWLVRRSRQLLTFTPTRRRATELCRNSLLNIFHDVGRKENGQLHVEREDWLWLMEKAPECVADILGFNFKAVDAGNDA